MSCIIARFFSFLTERFRRSAGNMRYARDAARKLGGVELALGALAAIVSLPLACTLGFAGVAMLGVSGGMGLSARGACKYNNAVARRAVISHVASFRRSARAPRSAARSLATRQAKDGDGGDADGSGSGDPDPDLVFSFHYLSYFSQKLITTIFQPRPCRQHGCCRLGRWAA
jgi:hypothetical protein